METNLKNTVKESSIILFSIIKWGILALIIGVVTGLAAGLFTKTLNFCSGITGKFEYYYFALPIIFFINGLALLYIFPNANVYTTNKLIEHVNNRKPIPIMSIPKVFILSIVTLSSGGSLGKEAPVADIGGSLASAFGKLLRLKEEDLSKLMVCGISAGFAAILGTPIAGSLFGAEVLFVGGILYEVLLPSFFAGIVSFKVSQMVLGANSHPFIIANIPEFNKFFFLQVIAAGIFFGICSIILIESIKLNKVLYNKIKVWKPFKNIWGGVFLVVLALLIGKDYLGLGENVVAAAISGEKIVIYAFLLKILFTSITYSWGGVGGMISPLLFIGATAGAAFANIMGYDPTIFAALGFVSVLAGATNTPISASILAIELFGPAIGVYAAVSSLLSFLITGNRTLFPAQILKIKKSSSLNLETGKTMEDTNISYDNYNRKKLKEVYNSVKTKLNIKSKKKDGE